MLDSQIIPEIKETAKFDRQKVLGDKQPSLLTSSSQELFSLCEAPSREPRAAMKSRNWPISSDRRFCNSWKNEDGTV